MAPCLVAALAVCTLSACATTGDLVEPPRVSLRGIELTDLDLGGQTFLLDFDVTNPNPFALPIKTVTYGVELDGHRLASGETQSAFTVPAGSDAGFAISVDVNLLQTAPQLLFAVRDSMRRDIPYELSGQFAVDIPFAAPVPFSSSGTVRLRAPAL